MEGFFMHMSRRAWERGRAGKRARRQGIEGFKILAGGVAGVKILPGAETLFNRPYRNSDSQVPGIIKGESPLMVRQFKNCVEIYTQEKYRAGGVGGGSIRGKIQAFTRKSRTRLMKLFMKLETFPNGFFTATYPDDCIRGLDDDALREKSSADIHLLGLWAQRAGIPMGLWRREWKPRQSGELQGAYAPHFHILAWIPKDGDLVASLRRKWLEIIGTGDLSARDLIENEKTFQWVENKRGVMLYVSKYTTKVTDASWGRAWGSWGDLPRCQSVDIVFDQRESKWVRRIVKRWLKSIGKRNLIRGLYARGTTYTYFISEVGFGNIMRLACEFAEIPF
jgi:hypothetical protein